MAMRSIKLQFVDEPQFYALPIRWFSHSEFCHVDYVTDRGTLIGARPWGGVAERAADYTAFKTKVVVEIPVSDDAKAKAEAWLAGQIGKPYDYGGLVGFLADRNWSADDKWFCSELTAGMLLACGLWPVTAAPLWRVTPNDLYLVACTLARG